MLAKRLPLLWTFAGGCLSGAALIALWPGEAETISSPRKQRVARSSEAVAPPIATTTAVQKRVLPNDAPDVLPDDSPDVLPNQASDAHAEPGSSVADVLVRLEAAYRQGLPAAAPAHAPSSPGADLTSTTGADAPTADVPAPLPARAQTGVMVAAPPPTNAPQVIAHAVAVAETDPAPALAPRDDTQPSNVNVHIGDTNQNTHVGDVFQGDVVVLQQVSNPGYLPYVAAPSRARVQSPAYPAYPAFPNRGVTLRQPTFASSWTVPNDRLGYDSALVPMLK